MGYEGAAVATVIGQIGTAFASLWYLRHMKLIRPERKDYALSPRICGKTLVLGMTSFLSQISLVASMAAINNMIRYYGALDPVFGQVEFAQILMAVVGFVMKFFQIVISIVVGMAAGCIPIVGFNMDAGRKDRVKSLFTYLLVCEALTGLISLILVEVFPKQLIGIFGAANESIYYTEFAVKAFRIYLCMIVFACVNKACFIFLQAMRRAAAAVPLVKWRRTTLVFHVMTPGFSNPSQRKAALPKPISGMPENILRHACFPMLSSTAHFRCRMKMRSGSCRAESYGNWQRKARVSLSADVQTVFLTIPHYA